MPLLSPAPALLRGAVAVLCVASAGCASSHAQLAPLPDANAPESERAAFYAAHNTLQVRVSTTTGGGVAAPGPFLLLKDGKRVTEPADLLQHVPPSSPTAQAALRATQKDDERIWWTVASAGLFTVGSAAMLGSLPAVVFLDQAGASADATLLASLGLLAAGSAVSLAGIVPMALSFAAAGDEALETETAFYFYDQDLKRQLRLPVDDAKVAAQPPPPPPSAPRHVGDELFAPDPS